MFMRRRRRGNKWIFGCFILLLVGFVYGNMTSDNQTPNKPNNPKISSIDHKQNIEKSGDEPDRQEPYDHTKPIVNNDNVVTNNTKLIFQTYYEKTRDTREKVGKIPVVLIGRPIDEIKTYLKENYKKWQIRKFDKDTIELYRAIDETSPPYYVAKENQGYIGIFQVSEEGSLVLIEQTNISIASLSEVDQEYLRKGIEKKEIDEINQLLEDYSS